MASKGGVVVVVAGKDDTGELFHSIDNHLAELRTKAKETSDSLGLLGKALQHGLEYAAGYASIDAFKDLISQSVEMSVQLGHLAQQTGISVQNLSVLRYASQQTGIEFETLTKGFRKLSTGAYEWEHGSAKAAQAFASLNISQRDMKATGGDMYRVMALVADRFQRMPDGINKSAIATELFGRSGVELISMLNHGSGGIESFRSEAQSLGLVLDKDGVEKMEEMRRKTLAAKGAISGMALSITSELAPATTVVASWIARNFGAGLDAIKEFAHSAKIEFEKFGLEMAGDFSDAAEIDKKDAAQKYAQWKASQTKQSSLDKPKSKGGLDFAPPKVKKQNIHNDGLLEARERAAQAIRDLAAEGAKAEEQKAKAHTETLLAILESQHKLGLVSESAYLTQKQTIQAQGFKAEQTALEKQKTALSAQMGQLSSEKPKTEKDRLDNAAKLNDLQKQMIGLDGQLVELGEQRKQKEVEITEARDEALRKQRAQVQQMEAELEQRTGGGSVKAIVAQRQKSAENRRNLANGGATPQQLAEFDALEKLEEEKIKIAALDRDGERIQREAALAGAKVEQQALSHAISNREADQQLATIRAAELAQLQQLSAAYAQYGEAGRDAEARVQSEITQTMQAMAKESDTRLKEIGEGYAHALFDPLFDMSEAWNKKGKSITDGLMRMTSQMAEKQFFGVLFGDDANGGSGGKSSNSRKGLSGTNGLVGEGLSRFDGFFHKKAKSVSNGTGVAGQGTLLSAAASAMQVGKGTSGSGGVQVILNNNGSAMQVESTQQSGGGDGGESRVIQIVLKQLDTNGPVAQRLASMFTT
jgi:hypothetical protein